MQQKQNNLVLVIGDFFISTRTPDFPDKFKELLVPNKLQHVICTGNVGENKTLDWLRDLSGNFTMVKGDEDDVGDLTESKVVTIGKFKIGVVHGHQIVPWGDDESLANYARELDCDILVYGHTHQPKVSSFSGKFLVNPGTATGAYSSLMIENNPSFCLFDVQEESVDVYFYEYKGGKVQISKTSLKDTKVETII